MRLAGIVTLLVLVGCQAPETKHETPAETLPDPYDIGAVHREVSTSSPEAQLWFDRGIAMAYGFNHEEAIRCFEKAAEADPDLAMAYWGKAYAIGPNYNDMERTAEKAQIAWDALQMALAHRDDADEVEAALIDALTARYPAATPPEDPAAANAAYAAAMREVHAAHPDDPDVAALTAEAVMLLRPWKLWTPDGEPAPETPEIRSILEPALTRWPDHPALAHLYIHTMEAGPHALDALGAARRLENLTPGLGHLRHMPSHIYVWTGRYDDVIRVNLEAVKADRAYVELAGRENFYTLYRLHNFHFVAYGGMWSGRREVAMSAARELASEIPPTLLAEFPDYLDIFTATPLHVMVRFGLWDEILAEPAPAPELLAAQPVWHYARGIALAVLGRTDEALQEKEAFVAARAAVPDSRVLFNNPVKEILAVAEQVLTGEIEYRLGHYDEAFAHLREAVELDRTLNYDEPWGWMEPARHALGALLVEQGRDEEAVEVYQANLARYPENGWALHGLAEALRGLGRDAEAADAQSRFERAFAKSDITIPGSCFCRTKT